MGVQLPNDYFLTKKIYAFSSECDNLRFADRLEFSQTFLNLKQFSFLRKMPFERLSCFLFLHVCCNDFIMENISAYRDLFQFIEILQFMHIL